MRLRAKAGFAIVMAAVLAPAAAQAVIFDFEANTPGTTAPFTDTIGGLSATFTGEASVCASSGLFVTLTGNVLIQDLCMLNQSGPLGVSFSSNLSSASFDFATAGGPATLTLQAFENASLVATSTFDSADPPGFFNGEGLASITATFNRLVITSTDLLAIDNLNAAPQAQIPEPTSIAVLGAGLFAFGFAWRRRRGMLQSGRSF